MSARDLPPALLQHVAASATLADGVLLGAGCVVKSGAVLGRGARLAAGVEVGPNAVVVDGDGDAQLTTIDDRARIGAGAVVHAGITIGARAVLKPGAVVARSVPPGAIVEGNPAAIVGYVDAAPQLLAQPPRRLADSTDRVVTTRVRGVTVHNLPLFADLRGELTVGEFERDVPFAPKRWFIVFGVPNREVRGEHAHRACHQFLVCVRGSCSVVADDGRDKVEVQLEGPQRGLYLPPLTWGIQYKHSADAMLLVFASHHYDAADYIRHYGDFLQEIGCK